MLRLAALALLAAVALAPAAEADQPAEIMHFWIAGSERAALDVIKHEFTRRGGRWLDNPQKSNLDLRRVLTDRLTTGTAPTALQWPSGAELQEMAEIGMIDNFDRLAARHHWDAVLPAAVKAMIVYDGHYFLAPTGLHGENWLFYNIKVLADHGIAPPRTLPELADAAVRLDAAGVTPFALGRAPWESRIMFTSLLLSTLGREDFSRLLKQGDVRVLDRPAAADAIDFYDRFSRHLGPDAARPAGWAEATAAVGAGWAAFIFQGDWAKGELMKLGYRPGVDFGCMLVPGTEHVLSAVVDTFAFPKSLVAATTDRDTLIETMLDPEVQLDFNRIKGSIPVRTDISDARLDPCGAIAQALLRTPDAVLSQLVQTMPTALLSDLHVLVGRMTNERDLSQRQALDRLRVIFAR